MSYVYPDKRHFYGPTVPELNIPHSELTTCGLYAVEGIVRAV